MIHSELIEEVLSHLSVASLLRFRCVSKSWCCIIDSDHFIKKHLNQSIIARSNHSLIYGSMEMGLYSVNLDSFDTAHLIQPPVDSTDFQLICISNYCNGLFLVVAAESLVLQNPFSRRHKKLPDAFPIEFPTDYSSLYAIEYYGLCYDLRKDDYKVVRVVEFHNLTGQWTFSETEILSLKSNSWNKVERFPYPLPLLDHRWEVYLNGALHSLLKDISHAYSGKTFKIMGFSVENENHYELMLPTKIPIENISMNLNVLGGCLSLATASEFHVGIWVMKKYGVEKSWTQLLSVGQITINSNGNLSSLRPLTYSKNGEKVLLYVNEEKLVWYDLRRNVIVDVLPISFCPELCVQSLVWPKER